MAENRKRDEIRLSDHFTYGRLIRFTLPSIAMMIFTSIYGVVDGIFVSNFVGETPFAALNLIMPYIMIFSAVGFMLGTGGSALVAFTLGTGDRKRANEIFSLLVYVLIALGALFTVVGIVLAEPASRLLGADEAMLPYCVLYARICFLGSIPFALQYAFQSFLITAEKPGLGLHVTVAAGVTNMFLDWLFVGMLGFGLAGAAWASVIGMVVGGVIPVVYFLRPNTSLLRLVPTKWYPWELMKAVTNGASEFMTNVSMSIVNMLYNFQLMRFAGQSGVAHLVMVIALLLKRSDRRVVHGAVLLPGRKIHFSVCVIPVERRALLQLKAVERNVLRAHVQDLAQSFLPNAEVLFRGAEDKVQVDVVKAGIP